MTQCFPHLFSSPSPSVLSIFNGQILFSSSLAKSGSHLRSLLLRFSVTGRKRKVERKKISSFVTGGGGCSHNPVCIPGEEHLTQSGGIEKATLCKSCGQKGSRCI